MKKLLTILLLFVGFAQLQATKYYIDPAGNNSTGDGSIGSPWLTLAYAASQVSGAGDTIIINPGAYTETARVNVSVGVSLFGNIANPPTVTSTYREGSFFAVWLHNTTVTNGNQSISYIKFDGSSYTAYGSIMVYYRSNVTIHNCEFNQFDYWGVRLWRPYAVGEPNPTDFATGNTFRNNIVTNCAGYYTDGYGGLGIDGQDNWLVSYNTFTQSNTTGSNGMPIKAAPGINKNGKILYNNIYQPQFVDGENWDFSIEFWDVRGGIEVAYNYCEGSIDIGGRRNIKGDYDYSIWVHHNTLKQKTQAENEYTRGFVIEGTILNEDIIIEYNLIQNVCAGIIFNILPEYTMETRRLKIRYNIFESMGLADSEATHSKGWGIRGDAQSGGVVEDVEIYNNIFTAKEGTYSTMWGIMIVPQVVSNYKVRNNIVIGFDYAPFFGHNNGNLAITCDYLWLENNLFYGNGNSNLPRYGTDYTPTNNTTRNQVVADPLFVGGSPYSYVLQEGSPAIDAGIDVGINKDYAGNLVPYNGVVDIGAYEYGSTITPAAEGLGTADGKFMKSKDGVLLVIQ